MRVTVLEPRPIVLVPVCQPALPPGSSLARRGEDVGTAPSGVEDKQVAEVGGIDTRSHASRSCRTGSDVRRSSGEGHREQIHRRHLLCIGCHDREPDRATGAVGTLPVNSRLVGSKCSHEVMFGPLAS